MIILCANQVEGLRRKGVPNRKLLRGLAQERRTRKASQEGRAPSRKILSGLAQERRTKPESVRSFLVWPANAVLRWPSCGCLPA